MLSVQFWEFSISLLLDLCSVFVSVLFFCSVRQGLNSVNPTISMRLRPKRTCSEVVCFGDFHIQQFSHLFIFLRGQLKIPRAFFFS